MPGIDKAKFLKRIAGAAPPSYGDDVPGMKEPGGDNPAEETDEGEISCGEQLMQALDSGDVGAVDAALREAVAKYK